MKAMATSVGKLLWSFLGINIIAGLLFGQKACSLLLQVIFRLLCGVS